MTKLSWWKQSWSRTKNDATKPRICERWRTRWINQIRINFLQPRPAMSGTQKGVITSLDTSARKITILTKLKIWSQCPEHPTCGHGATWAPGVRELLKQHLEQRKKTVFVSKLINNSAEMLYVICNKPHSIYIFAEQFQVQIILLYEQKLFKIAAQCGSI